METISICLSATLFVKKRISNSFGTLDGPSKQSQYKQVVKLGVVALGDTQNDSIRSWNFGKNWCNSISDSIVTDKNSNQTVILFKQLYNSKRLAMIQFNWQFNSVGTPVSGWVTIYIMKAYDVSYQNLGTTTKTKTMTKTQRI